MKGFLGILFFTILKSPQSLTSSNKYEFVEHKTIEGKPKLQYVGESLETIALSIQFHADFCIPLLEIAKLKLMAKTQSMTPTAVPFFYGNGAYIGRYVIEFLNFTITDIAPDGNIASITVDISLKEFPLEINIGGLSF